MSLVEQTLEEIDPDSGPLTILCVEDSDTDFLLLEYYLNDSFLNPRPLLCRVRTLAEALSALERTNGDDPFDIILLDLSLSDSLGSDTYIRIAELAPKSPVTILSGNDDLELAVNLVQRGAQDYLSKDSLNGELLTRSILYGLKRQRSRIEMAELNSRLVKSSEDLRAAQMQLIQAEKLDSLGRLAAGVAHEVKNPLATLQLGVDFFRRKMDLIGESGVILVDHMQHAIERADKIIRGMVDYSREEKLRPEDSNINRVVREAHRLIQHEVTRASVQIVEQFTDPIPAVHIDRSKMEQVLINVMMNAIQAMKSTNGGNHECKTLHIRTSFERMTVIQRDEGRRQFDRLRTDDPVVVTEIRDEGPGVPEEKISRIFEPFYTTKPTGEGTGLGLSVVRNIVDLHGGHIEAKNLESPRGLCVRIYLKAVMLPGPGEATEVTKTQSANQLETPL
jgi:signal transduction histidine kinase